MDTTHHIGYRRLGRGTPAGILLTLLIHGAIFGGAYLSQRHGVAPEATRELLVTQWVKLGKREPKLLPRIVEEPKAKAPEEVIKVAEDSTKPPPPPVKEPPRPKHPEPSSKLQQAMDRARRLSQAAVPDEVAEGDLSGRADGTANQAQAGDAYATAIFETIRRNWNAPTGLVSDAELGKLSTAILVRIAPDGTLLDAKMREPSGNALFDDSCLQAIKATGRVPPPPPELRARFGKGAVLAFDGKNLAR